MLRTDRCVIDMTSAEFHPTVDMGVVAVGKVTFRGTILRDDRWVPLEEFGADPVLARGGVLVEDYMATQEAKPDMAAALVRARIRAGNAAVGQSGGGLSGLRLRAGLSQSQIAQRMKTHQPSIARWEKDPEQMTLPTIRQMAAALGVPEQALFDALATAAEQPLALQEVAHEVA